jgi:predicted hotdog family 3-hydroxylacyl-ACP dehydratase
MRETKIIAVLLGICACVAASSVTAATIPAGTTLAVTTHSLITSQDAVGATFEAKIAQDVSAKGNVLLKAGTKAFGKVTSR